MNDGTLVTLPAAVPVDLITRQQFGDFVLSFEWCLPEGGNSGVLYGVSEEAEAAWCSGPEYQLVDDRKHADGAEPLTSCGAIYDVMAPEPRLSPLPAMFHSARIVMRDFTVEHWLSGVRVIVADLESRGVRHAIDASKFAGLPLFAAARAGHIVLQHHGAGAAFRRLTIEY